GGRRRDVVLRARAPACQTEAPQEKTKSIKVTPLPQKKPSFLGRSLFQPTNQYAVIFLQPCFSFAPAGCRRNHLTA
ncbi:hypothetical protein, partial [Paenibacillus validus]|uniref:hypothetical protein n=1 Tax=Paenibacillus validus TaxID=44253 RepID=UPI002E1C2686|nr:hypothetical protein [Paenibacillus validus]